MSAVRADADPGLTLVQVAVEREIIAEIKDALAQIAGLEELEDHEALGIIVAHLAGRPVLLAQIMGKRWDGHPHLEVIS